MFVLSISTSQSVQCVDCRYLVMLMIFVRLSHHVLMVPISGLVCSSVCLSAANFIRSNCNCLMLTVMVTLSLEFHHVRQHPPPISQPDHQREDKNGAINQKYYILIFKYSILLHCFLLFFLLRSLWSDLSTQYSILGN